MRKADKPKNRLSKFTGVFIPAEILAKRNISLIEKLIIADIGYFKENGYRVSNTVMAAKFNVSRRTIINSINRLKSSKLGFIIDIGQDDYHRCLKLNGEISALFSKGKGAKLAPVKQPTDGKKTYLESSEEFQLAKLLFDEIRMRKPDFKEQNLQAWARHIDLMMHKDNRKPDRIAQVIRWVQADSGNGSWQGWQNNILSAKKLREKFDKLELSMEKNNGNGSKNRECSEPVGAFIR